METGADDVSAGPSLDSLPADVLLLILGRLSLRDALRGCSACRRLRTLVSDPASTFWRQRVLLMAREISPHMNTKHLPQRPEQVSEKQFCVSLVKKSPQYVLMMRYNPAVSRDDAAEAVRQATNVSAAQALLAVLRIGHPLMNPAPIAERQGEVDRGSYEQVCMSLVFFEQVRPELQVFIEPLEYEFLPLEEESYWSQCTLQ